MNILVYRYGLLAPTENATLVREQIQKAHKYRNTLCEIERGRRNALRSLLSSRTQILELEARVKSTDELLQAALDNVRKQRSKTRSRSETVEQRDAIKQARLFHKEATAALREARRAEREDPATIAATDAINERAGELRRSARKYCGVHWGSYLLIEDEDQQAQKAPLYDGAEPNDPKFNRYTGEGRVGVQIQGGMDATQVFKSDTRLHIEPVNEKAWYDRSGGVQREKHQGKRGAMRTTISLRIGSQENRDPIWATWPMMMHRPIHEKAVIKRATVSLRKIGPREEWWVCITVELPEGCTTKTCGKGAVAIDLGWRYINGEIRVARWKGEDGDEGELRLTEKDISHLTQPERLRSVRDELFEVAKAELIKWLKAFHDVPEWLQNETVALFQWRSIARLAALANRWKTQRFNGDQFAYEPLEAWRYKDHHLWQWETSQRMGSLRRRREVYRIFAARLAKKYETVVFEDFDLRSVAVSQPTEEEKRDNDMARHHRQLAAVSALRLTVINAFRTRGGKDEKENAVDSTRTCHVCGVVEKFDAAGGIEHTCSGCGTRWDQDANASIVLLTRWLERARDEEKTAGARKMEKGNEPDEMKESRWVRAKRLAKEKLERGEGARKEEGKSAE